MHPEALTPEGKLIFQKLGAFPDFYLAGGTALALQIGHRVSVDFDLFTEGEINPNLLAKVKKIFPDNAISVSVNDPGELTVFINDVKITFLQYPFPLILPKESYEGVALLSIQEIAATKAYTLGRRGSYKEYVDLYFIVSEGHLSLNEIIMLSRKKYGNEFNGRLFLEQLIYIHDIIDSNIVFLKKAVSKEELRDFFEQEVKSVSI